MFNRKELELIEQQQELMIATCEDDELRRTMESIRAKCKKSLSYKLKTYLTSKKRADMDEMIDMMNKVLTAYGETIGDMACIGKFDDMKKEISAIQTRLGDMKGNFKGWVNDAARELKIVKERIKQELIEEGNAKSNAEAERKAEVDYRMEVAFSDYNLLETSAEIVYGRYYNASELSRSLCQSVSTARNSIIKEGYNN